MAASPVLADSSYYLRLLRLGQDPLRSLALAAEERDLAICGVVRCEVGRALRVPAVRKNLQDFWDVMVNVPTDHRLWEEAERVLWTLDRQGESLALTDVVIACCASRINAVVLTFDRIPGVRTCRQLGW